MVFFHFHQVRRGSCSGGGDCGNGKRGPWPGAHHLRSRQPSSPPGQLFGVSAVNCWQSPAVRGCGEGLEGSPTEALRAALAFPSHLPSQSQEIQRLVRMIGAAIHTCEFNLYTYIDRHMHMFVCAVCQQALDRCFLPASPLTPCGIREAPCAEGTSKSCSHSSAT